jgi:hypothetical protein
MCALEITVLVRRVQNIRHAGLVRQERSTSFRLRGDSVAMMFSSDVGSPCMLLGFSLDTRHQCQPLSGSSMTLFDIFKDGFDMRRH